MTEYTWGNVELKSGSLIAGFNEIAFTHPDDNPEYLQLWNYERPWPVRVTVAWLDSESKVSSIECYPAKSPEVRITIKIPTEAREALTEMVRAIKRPRHSYKAEDEVQ